MASQHRSSSPVVSKKLQALKVIKAHFRESGKAPSYRDIGRVLDTSSKRVFELVRALAADGDIILRPGRRGIMLPEPAEMLCFEDLMSQIEQAGFVVFRHPPGSSPGSGWPLTRSPLPLMPELDEIPPIERAADDATDL